MIEALMPIEAIDGETYVIRPSEIVSVTPYGLGSKITTWEEHTIIYQQCVSEKVTYITELTPNQIMKTVTGKMHFIKFAHQSFVNIRHIIASNEMLIKHRGGYSFVDPSFKFVFASLCAEYVDIQDLRMDGIHRDIFSLVRLLN